MKFTINLATRRYINQRQLNLALAFCFLVMAALLILEVREVAYNQAELTTVHRLSASAGNRPGQPVVSDAQLKALEARVRFANTLIDRKTANWLGLLDRLEEVVPDGVALTTIQPNPQTQAINIGGVARSFTELRTLLENMERSRSFTDVYILSQADTKFGKSQHGITFNVTCKVVYR
jgi:type IV pilus assembly protein PilN